ncbi:MAG: acetyl-coenzyme A synthetase N-terminal domain-containing protein, partial [Planctomycetota bacterium]|nr:acetyl-coenzyme A synthetase N-terminal domain-containing protein [Planctomycetota bacterium]
MSQIESVLQESRLFPPSAVFKGQARLSDEDAWRRMYRESIDDPESFWDRIAGELPWIEPYEQVLDWSSAPVAKWFVGGKLNASAVCL